VRTGTRGYFLAVCADHYVRLHMLGETPAGNQNLLKQVTGFDPARVVVGLLARGSTFTIYVDGAPLATLTSADIPSGRLGVGGFAPDRALDATIIQYRAWTPSAA
jgi:hypothetical protein